MDERDVAVLAERIWKNSNTQSAAITESGHLWFQALAATGRECPLVSGMWSSGLIATRILCSPGFRRSGQQAIVIDRPHEELIDKPTHQEEGWDEYSTPFNPDWLLLLELPKPNIAPDALAFCRQQGLLRYLLMVIELIKQCFPRIQEFYLRQEQDPETGEKWLTLDISLQGEVDAVLDSYDAYTSKLISIVPWPERDKFRLSYDIV
jgi:hypothetical protein